VSICPGDAAHPGLQAGLGDVAACSRPAEQPQAFPDHLLCVILRWHWHPPIGGVSNNTLPKVSVPFLVPQRSGTTPVACSLPVTYVW
jgi:hypothetical protein